MFTYLSLIIPALLCTGFSKPYNSNDDYFDEFSDDEWLLSQDNWEQEDNADEKTTTTIVEAETSTIYCPWPPCYANSWNVDFNSIPMGETQVESDRGLQDNQEQQSTPFEWPASSNITEEQQHDNDMVINQDVLQSEEMEEDNCGGTRVIIKEKTSSALIIMGIFFCVVVIGLFYYLPQWKPRCFAGKQRDQQVVPPTDSEPRNATRTLLDPKEVHRANSNIYEQVEHPRALRSSDQNAF